MTVPTNAPEVPETEAIRGDIERTRGDMSRTVNEIEERLSPARIKEQVASVTAGVTADIEKKVADLKDSVIGNYHETKDHLKEDLGRELRGARHMVSDEFTQARAAVHDATIGKVQHMVHDARDTVTDAGTSVLDTIKQNPVPAALIGVGIGWLLLGGRRSSGRRTLSNYRYDADAGYGYAEGRDERDLTQAPRRAAQRAMQTARGVGEKVSHFAQDAEHRVEEIAGNAREGAMHLASDARVRSRNAARSAGRQIVRAEQSVEATLRENPLALGAIAVAVGAAIALALPHTRVEDEWMGEAKERLVDRAQGVAGDAIHRAEEAVGQLTAGEKAAQDEAKAGQGSYGPQSERNGLSHGLSNGLSSGPKSSPAV